VNTLFGRVLPIVLAAGWLRLALHRSAHPEVFGTWSSSYAAFLTAAGFAAMATGWLLRPAMLRSVSRPAAAGVALMLALSLLTAEGAVRALDLFGSSYYEETARYLRDTQPDPLLGYRHLAERQTRYQGVTVDFNELGMRDRPLDDRATKRVLLLGDSVTFGWGVAAEKTFGRRLEAWLDGARTVNAGVCGYNTVQQRYYLETEGFALDPYGVVLLYSENDVEPTLEIAEEGPLHASRLYRLWEHLGRVVFGPGRDPVEAASARNASLSALRSISESCRRRGIPFAVFFYRLRRSEANERLWSDVAAVAMDAGFTLTDTASWFEERDLDEWVNSYVDSRPNPQAHAVLARGIAETLGGGTRASR